MRKASGQPVAIFRETGSSTLVPIKLESGAPGFDETKLQELIHNHPEVLPIHEIEPGFGSVISVCREMPTSHGPIDNLLITEEGNIVLVEVKLWRNPEARRKVVAQALDYASCLFEMSYEEFEATALKGIFGDGVKPETLYALLNEKDANQESVFAEAIEANLRRGRILILVVGDGIRSEAMRLTGLFQQHAGAHFTFALVELSLYELGAGGDILVCPRTLMQTQMMQRVVVEIDDRRAKIQSETVQAIPATAKNISAEQFYEVVGEQHPELEAKIKGFIATLEPMQVYPEFRSSLNFKWDPPSGRSLNLGYIQKNGQVWSLSNIGSLPAEIGQAYIEELAQAMKLTINKETSMGWYLARSDGKTPRIAEIADRLADWLPVIRKFQERVIDYLASIDR